MHLRDVKCFQASRLLGRCKEMRTEKTARGRGRGWETLSFSSSLFFSRSLTSRRTSLPPSEIQEPRKETLSKLIWLSFRGEREEGEGPIVLKEHKQKKEKLFAFDNVQTFGVLVVVSIKEKNCVYILLKACFVKTIFFFLCFVKTWSSGPLGYRYGSAMGENGHL